MNPFKPFIHALVSLSLVLAPYSMIDGGRAWAQNSDDVLPLEEMDLDIDMVGGDSAEEVLNESSPDSPDRATVAVFRNEGVTEDEWRQMLADAEKIADAHEEETGKRAHVITIDEKKTKSLLARMGPVTGMFKRYASKVSRYYRNTAHQMSKRPSVYKIKMALYRAGFLFPAVLHSSFYAIGMTFGQAGAMAAVAVFYTILVQYYGDTYLEILGDSRSITKAYKWLRSKGMKSMGANEDEIIRKMGEIDKSKFTKWLNKQELGVGMVLYFLTELPIIVSMFGAAALLGPIPGVTESFGAFMYNAVAISLAALSTQGLIDPAIGRSRREKLRLILKEFFPQIEDELARAEEPNERDEIFIKYSDRLKRASRMSSLAHTEEDAKAIKDANIKREVINFNMNFRIMTVSVVSNMAALAVRSSQLPTLALTGLGILYHGYLSYRYNDGLRGQLTRTNTAVKNEIVSMLTEVLPKNPLPHEVSYLPNCSQKLTGNGS